MGDSAIHAVAGAVGGAISMTLTYPLVNLSTRAAVATKHEDVSLKDAIVQTVKKEGLSGLYSGLESSLFGIALTNGIYYLFYEETRSQLIKRRTVQTGEGLSTSEGIIAGMIAGSITTTLTNPVWTVQAYQSTKVTTNAEGKVEKPTMGSAASDIIKQSGIKGLWRGLGPALILVINPVIQYTTFERMVSLLLNYRAKKAGAIAVATRSALSDRDLFVLGALSKLIATGITYPYLVVKSRLQVASHKYKSSVTAVLEILKTEGLRGIYAGLGPKLLQSALTAAFMFVAQRRLYEVVKSLIVQIQARKAIPIAKA
jgi:adenine nucleotide transporter 17